jgi:hypothetical protein
VDLVAPEVGAVRRSTLILLLAAVAAVVWLWYFELKKESPRDRVEDDSTAAFTFAAADISGVTIIRGGETIELVRRGERWMLTRPVETRADQTAASSLASSLAGARIRRRFTPDPARLSEYGLEPPAVTLELALATGERHRLRLGARDFSGAAAYAFLDDSADVALVPGALLAAAEKSLEDLRDMAALGFTSWDVASAELRGPRGLLRLERAGSEWKITAPVEDLADSSEVSARLHTFGSARIAEIVAERADDLRRYGLDRPRYELRVRTEKGEELALSVGARAGRRHYARDASRPMVFTLEDDVVEDLDASLFDLRDKRPVRAEAHTLRRVVMERTGRERFRLALEKDGEEKWRVVEPAGGEFKDREARVERILEPLTGARAEEIADRPSAAALGALELPAAEVVLVTQEGAETRVTLAAVGGALWLRSSARKPLFRVPRDVLQRLPGSVEALFETAP